MYFAGRDVQVQAFQDGLTANRGMQILDFQHVLKPSVFFRLLFNSGVCLISINRQRLPD
jgi:hypothetical protein